MKVIANFLEDVRRQLLAELRDAGFVTARLEAASVSEVSHAYYNVRNRLPSQRKRRVLRSTKLAARALPADIATVVDAITQTSEAGGSLLPFLHKKLTKNPSYDDLLLNDWGIFHLHVGSAAPAPGQRHVDGRYELLFAAATPETLFLIDLLDHDSFDDFDLLEIVHAEWPELMAADRADRLGFEPVENGGYLRRGDPRPKKFNMMIQLQDGTLYLPPGGGRAVSGASLKARIEADRLLNYAKEIEEHFEANAAEIAVLVQERTGQEVAELCLRLDLEADGLVVVETQTGARFPQPG